MIIYARTFVNEFSMKMEHLVIERIAKKIIGNGTAYLYD
jgi:hypothetical protein